ncbi:DEAD/DEAH box helicase [Kitasatospora sp. NPDC008115]|uniref:DEAD/DEAH box helicase n=1 Tax=Kitasatospora sp. NPDC008115 TaxID=3364022 RepID=UPI0036EE2A78
MSADKLTDPGPDGSLLAGSDLSATLKPLAAASWTRVVAMAFERKSQLPSIPDDPLQLYRQLAQHNRGPAAVWGHQQDVLRDWHANHHDDPDVAIELPTGAGKTLVGGLIAEYVRRKEQARVAYLCPTRQLARQTAAKLNMYGIPNVLLVHGVASWNQAHRASFESGNAVAVSVYSHVFNSNPALNQANLLVLDDAHAAEGYVAGPWKLEIDRATHESAYLDLLSVLAPTLDPLLVARLSKADPDSQYLSQVYLASPLGVTAHSAQIEEVIAAAVSARKVSRESLYPWQLIQGHVARCMVYVSYRQMLIRPLIAPTFQHSPFSDPARRIYMSATLGSGGELERSFGRRKIKRIPIPPGWDRESTGRRLFVFPGLADDLAASPDQMVPFLAKVVGDAGRAVALTPDRRTAQKFREMLPDDLLVLDAGAVEDDLSEFTSKPSAALVLSNRYDGIDLPDEDCRLVVLVGLPARGDLQERFLHGSLGAVEVLDERIRARIQQGAGRATRNLRDYTTVLVLGNDLSTYLSRRDVWKYMHPEVHAELEFGWDTSQVSSTAILENLAVFSEHAEEWAVVDQDISSSRDKLTRLEAPSAVDLQRAVQYELAATNAIWEGNWPVALGAIRSVLDKLAGKHAPKRYAALWSYLAFSIAERQAELTGDISLRETAKKYYSEARRFSQGTTWLSNLAAPSEQHAVSPDPDLSPVDAAAMSQVLAQTELARPEVYDVETATARAGLAGTEYVAYEAGLVFMGKLAGAEKTYGDDGTVDAAPDAVWLFKEAQWLTWEAKSQAKATGMVGADNVRQAGAHLRFTEAEQGGIAPGDSVSFLVTAKPAVHPSAQAVAEPHVYLVRPTEVLDLFDRLNRAWKVIRSRGLSTLSVHSVAAIFRAEQALPSQWLPDLRRQPLKKSSSS